jgi:hypothetical protein
VRVGAHRNDTSACGWRSGQELVIVEDAKTHAAYSAHWAIEAATGCDKVRM